MPAGHFFYPVFPKNNKCSSCREKPQGWKKFWNSYFWSRFCFCVYCSFQCAYKNHLACYSCCGICMSRMNNMRCRKNLGNKVRVSCSYIVSTVTFSWFFSRGIQFCKIVILLDTARRHNGILSSLSVQKEVTKREIMSDRLQSVQNVVTRGTLVRSQCWVKLKRDTELHFSCAVLSPRKEIHPRIKVLSRLSRSLWAGRTESHQ